MEKNLKQQKHKWNTNTTNTKKTFEETETNYQNIKKHIHSNINKKGKKLNIEATQTKKHRNKKLKGIWSNKHTQKIEKDI